MDTVFKWCFSEILDKNGQFNLLLTKQKLLRESRLVQVVFFPPSLSHHFLCVCFNVEPLAHIQKGFMLLIRVFGKTNKLGWIFEFLRNPVLILLFPFVCISLFYLPNRNRYYFLLYNSWTMERDPSLRWWETSHIL